MRSGTNGLFYFAGVAFDRGGNKPSSIFVARYMDLNNREAGDPFGYVDTRLVDSDPGTRFLDKVALATDIPRTAATCTIASTPVRRQAGRSPDRARPHHSRRARLRRVRGLHRLGGDRAVGHHDLAVDQLRPDLERADRLSTGSRLVQNPQIAVSPVDGAVYVSWRRFEYTSQDNAVMIVKSINGGATFSKPLRVSGLRSFDLITSRHAVPQQRLPDHGDRRHRPRLSRLARPRLRGGAQRSG